MMSGFEETNLQVLLIKVTQCTAETNKSGNEDRADGDVRAKIFVSLTVYM